MLFADSVFYQKKKVSRCKVEEGAENNDNLSVVTLEALIVNARVDPCS